MHRTDDSHHYLICLLRPTLVRTPAGSVVPRPSLRRNLLELLALHAREAVATGVIVEELWGGATPVQPEQAVHAHVGRLRKGLARYGFAERELALHTVGGGYMLDVDPSRVDALHFVSLVKEAAAMAPQHGSRAITVLNEALAVWQGQPFGGVVEGEHHRLAVKYWEETHTLALREWAQAHLCQGQPQKVIARLRVGAMGNSVDENLHALLITALCRAGRKVDALEVYRSLRNRLVRDHGIEPSPAFQRLYQEVLLDKSDESGTCFRPGRLPAPAFG